MVTTVQSIQYGDNQMKAYTIELWVKESLYNQSVTYATVEAETESEAISRLKQTLLDKGLLPYDCSKITYYANIVTVKDNCIGR